MATGSRSKGRRPKCNFTAEERETIVQYIVKHEAYDNIKGVLLWREMEKEITNHTWQSLKQHFLKKIIPLLHTYNLPPGALQFMRKSAVAKARHTQKKLRPDLKEKNSKAVNGCKENDVKKKKRKLLTASQTDDALNKSEVFKTPTPAKRRGQLDVILQKYKGPRKQFIVNQSVIKNCEQTSHVTSNENPPGTSKNSIDISTETSDVSEENRNIQEKSCWDNVPPNPEDPSSNDAEDTCIALLREQGNCNSTVQELIVPESPSNSPSKPVVQDIDAPSVLGSDLLDDTLASNTAEDVPKNTDEDDATDSEWSDDGFFWKGECNKPSTKRSTRREYALYKPRPAPEQLTDQSASNSELSDGEEAAINNIEACLQSQDASSPKAKDVAVQYNQKREMRDVSVQTEPVLLLPFSQLSPCTLSNVYSKLKQLQ